MDAELHGASSLLKLKVLCRVRHAGGRAYGSLFVRSPLNLTQPWKFLEAPVGKPVALAGSICLYTSLEPLPAYAEPQAGVSPQGRSRLYLV